MEEGFFTNKPLLFKGIKYDYLRGLSRKWRLLVTTLKALKNLDFMFLKELVSTLNFHEQELQQDEGLKIKKVSGSQSS